MIRGILKAVFLGWVTKKIAQRAERRNPQRVQPSRY
jgi:hypothetical protein